MYFYSLPIFLHSCGFSCPSMWVLHLHMCFQRKCFHYFNADYVVLLWIGASTATIITTTNCTINPKSALKTIRKTKQHVRSTASILCADKLWSADATSWLKLKCMPSEKYGKKLELCSIDELVDLPTTRWFQNIWNGRQTSVCAICGESGHVFTILKGTEGNLIRFMPLPVFCADFGTVIMPSSNTNGEDPLVYGPRRLWNRLECHSKTVAKTLLHSLSLFKISWTVYAIFFSATIHFESKSPPTSPKQCKNFRGWVCVLFRDVDTSCSRWLGKLQLYDLHWI